MAFRVTRTARPSRSVTVPEGGGRLALGSDALEAPCTLRARVEEGQPGANPEELIGAGHGGCARAPRADRRGLRSRGAGCGAQRHEGDRREPS